MYTFEKDESIIELIQMSESKNKTKAENNLPFKTASENSRINFSISFLLRTTIFMIIFLMKDFITLKILLLMSY